jgi:predicted dehydrogenase
MRIGFIGTGRRAWNHITALSKIESAKIVAVCDIQEERVNEAAQKLNAVPYTDHRRMLDREELDAVYICSPPLVHAEQVEDAAERGVHIVLEKPISLNMEDAGRMLRAVRDGKVICSVGYQLRYLDICDEVLGLLKGRPFGMAVGYYYWTTPLVKWIQDRNLTGGQIVEQATHLIDLFRMFGGDIRSVYAAYSLQTRVGQEGFNNWDVYSVTMRFKNGGVGTFSATYALFPGIPQNTGIDLISNELLIRIRGNTMERFERVGGEVLRERTEAKVDPTYELSVAFVKAVEEGRTELIRSPLEDAVKSLMVTLAANRSAMTREVIEL